MYFDFANVLIFVIVAVIFILAALTIGRIIRPSRSYSNKLETYECGEKTIGTSYIQFNIRFYIIAIIFLIFDIEIAILFPWVLIFKRLGTVAFIEMIIFVAILLVGLTYVWVKGDLEWVKKIEQDRDDTNGTSRNISKT